MAYFDAATVSGFTLRIFYEEKLGIVSITDIQLKSTNYTGHWYPGGTISVNGVPVLTMDFNSPATHSFSIWQVGDTFVPIRVQSGASLPVSSERILAGTTTISVDVRMYRDGSTTTPRFSGSVTIDLTAGAVYVDTGSGFERYLVYVDNGTGWDHCIPYIDDGTSWNLCC